MPTALLFEFARYSAGRVTRSWQTHAWVAVLLATPFGLTFYQAAFSGASEGHVYLVFAAFCIALAWGVGLSLVLGQLPSSVSTRIISILTAYCTVFIAASTWHQVLYGEQLGVASLLAVSDSHAEESAEFLRSTVSAGLIAVVGLAAIGTAVVGMLARVGMASGAGDTSRWRWPFLAVMLAGWLVLTLGIERGVGAVVMNNPVLFSWASGTEVLRVRGMTRDFSPDSPRRVGASLANTVREEPLHVLVIGESVTSSHMGLNGYERNTTPDMEKDRSVFERFVAADACSPRHNTILALEDVLTGLIDAESPPAFRPNLMSIAREAGYRTVWISNQAPAGDFDSMSSAWALTADERKFVTSRGIADGVSFDEELLPELQRAIEERTGPTLIVVHMLGAHQNYVRRYPADFQTWADDAPVPDTVPRRNREDFPLTQYNRYDNAVRYTDHVVGRILDLAARHDAASVTYFSDHGQNLGERSAALYHSMADGPRQGFEVPLAIWMAPSWEEQAAFDRNILQGNLALPFQTDRLLFTLADLYAVDWQGRPESESLASAGYVVKDRRCDAMPY